MSAAKSVIGEGVAGKSHNRSVERDKVGGKLSYRHERFRENRVTVFANSRAKLPLVRD